MREISRLDGIYNNLKQIHKSFFPDWRFGQLIMNLMAWYANKYNRDIFYIEDDKIHNIFKEFAKDMTGVEV